MGHVIQPQKVLYNVNKITKINISVFMYSLCECILSNVKNTKYLGLTISQDLKWEPYINELTGRANKTLGFLRRNLKHCPQQLKQLAYISLVRSRLEYASACWDPYLNKDILKVESVQRRAARFVCNNYKQTSSVTDMLNTLGWDTLQYRRQHNRIRMMTKIVKQKVAIPSEAYLSPANTRTRAANSYKFRHIAAKTSLFQNSFFPRTIPEWNTYSDTDLLNIAQSEPPVPPTGPQPICD